MDKQAFILKVLAKVKLKKLKKQDILNTLYTFADKISLAKPNFSLKVRISDDQFLKLKTIHDSTLSLVRDKSFASPTRFGFSISDSPIDIRVSVQDSTLEITATSKE